MFHTKTHLITFTLTVIVTTVCSQNLDLEFRDYYTANWYDLDTRPLPQWYDEAKVGIFLHWGVYSVPGVESEWFWKKWRKGDKNIVDFMQKNYPPGFTYQEFAPMFTAEFFDPDSWAKLFVKSGAKYVILTSKHHDGYTLFPSKRTFSWNSVEVGPKQDLVGNLSKAVRRKRLKFGVYYSLYEWFNPLYVEDKTKRFTTQNYVSTKVMPELKQLVEDYKLSVIWSDGCWEASDKYWQSAAFISWLYNNSTVRDEVVVNDRWGIGIAGRHGDFFNFGDRFNNKTLQYHKWENAFTVDKMSWGYRRNMDLSQVLSVKQLITEVVTTVSCGGNVLINIGPTKEGTISPIFRDRLLSLGRWLAINGEAIYQTSPWLAQNDTYNANVWYTCTKTRYNTLQPTGKPTLDDVVTAIYAITLEWPERNILTVQDLYLNKGDYQVKLLGNEAINLTWTAVDKLLEIQFPDKDTVKSYHAWALKITNK